MKTRALMVLGTASHAGKSLTAAALCRILRQDGFNVAPFKAQNMALNSFATREGHEIGRAQAMQAQAAGIEPHVDMNPILLKPTSEVGSQVVINGKVFGNYRGADYYRLKPLLLDAVSEAYRRLASRHEIIVLEGAGSPVEMNLKDRDVVNMKMAEIADARCMLVTDIDRGGVFASLVGTYALLEPRERARFGGFLINKFRGDVRLFTPGVDYLENRLSQPCLGVIP
jgi:adenosylcobyric acid synthase